MGYGSRTLRALNSFDSGEYFILDEAPHPEPSYSDKAPVNKLLSSMFAPLYATSVYEHLNRQPYHTRRVGFHFFDNETVVAVIAMPPLLQRLTERKAESGLPLLPRGTVWSHTSTSPVRC